VTTVARAFAVALLAAIAGGLVVHSLAKPGVPPPPPPAPRATEGAPARSSPWRLVPSKAELAREDSPEATVEPSSEELEVAEPRADWRAEADSKIEREVSELRGERQVRAYLDQLLSEARQRGAVTPVETNVGRHAVRALVELQPEERDRMLNDYQERLLDLQAELQGTARPVIAPTDSRRAPDRLLAELRRGGQSREARAELRADLMNAIRALPPEEQEAKLSEVHAALAGERAE
jgi:hypothetical protein